MSIQQLNTFLRNQDEYSRRFWAAPLPMFFQYDYAESQQVFKNKYPSSELRSLGGLSSWEWFIDGNSLPNIRLRFYNQRLHDPVAPVLPPATTIDQCKMRPPPGLLGFVYAMSNTDLAALEQEQSLKGRQQLYLPIELQTKSANGTLTTKVILASVFMDMANTRDGFVDLTNEFTNLYWVTAIKRMLQTGMLMWYVKTIEMKLRGIEMSFEPFFINHKDNPVDDPRATRKQTSISSFASLKQRQQEEQQKEDQEKRRQTPKQPIITFSQKQKDAMLQQIFRHGNIPMEQASKLTEKQKNFVVGRYLRKRQLVIHERQKTEQEQQKRPPNPNVAIPAQQQQNEPHIQIPDQQQNPHTEAILNDVFRKQKKALREEESRYSSSMPPPTQPTQPARPARRSSQSGQLQGEAQKRNENTKSSPTQLNYPQKPNNLKKRAASNSMSSANGNGAQGAKRRNMGGGGKGEGRGSTSASTSASTSTTNANASESAAAPEPKRKYAGRGRPRKTPIVQPLPAVETSTGTGTGTRTGNSRHVKQAVGTGGKVRANVLVSSGDGLQDGCVGANGNLKGNNNMLNKTQLLPHVQQAARMVHYFQPKVGVDSAGDGRLQ
ncbi:15cc1169-8710-4bde-bdef-b73989f140bd [Sclerotinia trifoliorum]|uniref:15cc1169-8710-4bde-bdef-b73989f140bd n=1 Tax=Sclerotinia trifoliorum TaxID=28548 RepID=A0A8H2VV17_9HELO|nr:15cc1169-8710-4bde-bdef-b73989f140bd [Sclerotinia trifoliorum]